MEIPPRAGFAAQKQNAAHLRHGFRLGTDRALKDWEVPKIPQTEPSAR